MSRQFCSFVFTTVVLVVGCERQQSVSSEAARLAVANSDPSKPRAQAAGAQALCETAVKGVMALLLSEVSSAQSAPGMVEVLTMDAALKASFTACEKEGISEDQLGCIQKARSMTDLAKCGAIAKKTPSWITLPPPGMKLPEQPKESGSAVSATPERLKKCGELAEHFRVFTPDPTSVLTKWLMSSLKATLVRRCVQDKETSAASEDCLLRSKTLAELKQCPN